MVSNEPNFHSIIPFFLTAAPADGVHPACSEATCSAPAAPTATTIRRWSREETNWRVTVLLCWLQFKLPLDCSLYYAPLLIKPITLQLDPSTPRKARFKPPEIRGIEKKKVWKQREPFTGTKLNG